jgi:DNA-binding beta-propeller fold protein YncE
MRSLFPSLAAALTTLLPVSGSLAAVHPESTSALRLIGTVNMPGIDGDFDHFATDLKNNRLFLAAEEHHTVEVFDLHSGKPIYSIKGFDTPHSILYVPESDKLFVIDGGKGGSCQILNGITYAPLKSIKLSEDADALVYDAANHLLYVGNGGKEAGNDYSLITVIDTTKGEKVGEIKLPSANLEAMALQQSGSLLYVNMRDKNQIGVVDRKTKSLVSTWPLSKVAHNTPLALDEANHRLFVAGRKPGVFGVVNTGSGKEVAVLPATDGVDDMAFDPASKRIYIACADGYVDVYKQIDADHYLAIDKVPTGNRGKIGVLVPSLHLYFVATSKKDDVPAKLFMFEVVD